MMYFIPWCVFLVAVILAVPVASVMEKRQRPESDEPMMEEEFVDGEAEPVSEFGAEEVAEPLADEPMGGELVEFEEFQ